MSSANRSILRHTAVSLPLAVVNEPQISDGGMQVCTNLTN